MRAQARSPTMPRRKSHWWAALLLAIADSFPCTNSFPGITLEQQAEEVAEAGDSSWLAGGVRALPDSKLNLECWEEGRQGRSRKFHLQDKRQGIAFATYWLASLCASKKLCR